MTSIHPANREQKSVDIRPRRPKMTPLAGHTEHPQLGGQPNSSCERRLADQTIGASQESIAFMPSIIQCRAARLSNFVLPARTQWLSLGACALESSVFSPSH
jgi:hypothetical protein